MQLVKFNCFKINIIYFLNFMHLYQITILKYCNSYFFLYNNFLQNMMYQLNVNIITNNSKLLSLHFYVTSNPKIYN